MNNEIIKNKTSGKELLEYFIENKQMMVNDGFSFSKNPNFPHKIEFSWTPNKNKLNFKTKVSNIFVYINDYEEVDYDTYICIYIKTEGKKIFDIKKTKIVPIFNELTNKNDYSNINANFFYTMYNILYDYIIK